MRKAPRIDPRRFFVVTPAFNEDEEDDEEEDDRDETPVRVVFSVPETQLCTTNYRIFVPQYVIDEGEDSIRRYIRDNIEMTECRGTDTYDCTTDWDDISDISY